jgi:UDP-N-acetylmuramoyl-L-alanine---L-glutamate ligase
MIQQFFSEAFSGKSICILGFAREGRSSYKALKQFSTGNTFFIADSNPAIIEQFKEEFGDNEDVIFYCGTTYRDALHQADIIIKSPGISTRSFHPALKGMKLFSQTEIFLHLFRHQVIGVTGTKGKSTTVSLLYHIFKIARFDVVLAGNIGIPPFELLDKITEETIIVYEMSSHQLENSTISPSTAILLNIYQEHLDHYVSYKDYQLAKMNIARWQNPEDVFIVNTQNPVLKTLLDELECQAARFSIGTASVYENEVFFEKDNLVIKKGDYSHYIEGVGNTRKLQGDHNLINISAAALAAHLKGVDDEAIKTAVATFEGLNHRLEYVREFKGAWFYNDSISTIPEATIEALKTFPTTETLILGGFDRGIDYRVLADYLVENPVTNLILIGKAGARIHQEIVALANDNLSIQYFLHDDFTEAVLKAADITPAGKICLLSPAAASYDMFKNFEERGEVYKRILNGLK